MILIKPSNSTDVRISKYIKCLKNYGQKFSFIGWNRQGRKTNLGFDEKFILSGFNTGRLKLIGYILWYIKLTCHLTFKTTRGVIYYAADFESAFPCYLVSRFKNLKYIYDVYDDVALRYPYGAMVKKMFQSLDDRVKSNSLVTIHVDENRVTPRDSNFIIIPNVPIDVYKDHFQSPVYQKSFAVTGWLTETRGVFSILKFAKDNPGYNFFVFGVFDSPEIERAFKCLDNVQCGGFMDQAKLFEVIRNCSGIFALYDTTIEINVKAASNKIWDAMMLAIPVIVNKGMIIAKYVEKHNIGCVVNYEYDESWAAIHQLCHYTTALNKGLNGRRLFKDHMDFETQFTGKFLPLLSSDGRNKYLVKVNPI